MSRQPVAVVLTVALVVVAVLHMWPHLHMSRLMHGGITVVVLAAAGVLIRSRVTPWHPDNPKARHPEGQR